MAIQNIFLLLPTYPDAPSEVALESALLLAQSLGAQITASLFQLDADKVARSLGAWPVDVPGLVEEALQRSESNAKLLTDSLKKLAAEFRVSVEFRSYPTSLFALPQSVVDVARLNDLTVIPVWEASSFDRNEVEVAIFDTGRPALLLPSGRGHKALRSLDTIVVAWDFSREAARALADALPILTQAKRVFILSIIGEKGIYTTCTTQDLEKYLVSHGVDFVIEQRTLKEGSVSELMTSFAAEKKADMLVMGAYGHSRFREFLLGGATSGVLSDPTLPIFLSH